MKVCNLDNVILTVTAQIEARIEIDPDYPRVPPKFSLKVVKGDLPFTGAWDIPENLAHLVDKNALAIRDKSLAVNTVLREIEDEVNCFSLPSFNEDSMERFELLSHQFAHLMVVPFYQGI